VLRAIAALMECVFHFAYHVGEEGDFLPADNWFRQIAFFGSEGVYVFFVISGFIIPYALYQSRYTLQNYFRFLLKRFLRLHPPYVLSMLLSGLVVLGYAIWYWKPFVFEWHRIAAHFVFLVPWQETEWFNAIYWTLALEFQYYIVIALIFPLLVKNRMFSWLAIAVFMVLGIVFPDRRLVFLFAPVFAAGMSVFLAKEKKFFWWEAALVVAIAAIQARYLISPATAVTTLLTTLAVAFWNWESKPTNWMGEISYSLYLTHGFSGGQILYFFGRYFHSFGEKMILLFLAVLASLIFAWIYWRIIEVPSMEWSKLVKYKRPPKTHLQNP